MNETTIYINHGIENIDKLIGHKVKISIDAVITGITVDNNIIMYCGAPVSNGRTTELKIVEYDATITKVDE